MSICSEFKTVDLILDSTAPTRGVDAFSLSLIKCEKQLRRIFTHLVYQSPSFSESNIPELRSILEQHRSVYFKGFVKGFDGIFHMPLRDMVGEPYDLLMTTIESATSYRNKIFHGQLTSANLSRDDLISYVEAIRRWCDLLAVSAEREIGYAGFQDSFRKSTKQGLFESLKEKIISSEQYGVYIVKNMIKR